MSADGNDRRNTVDVAIENLTWSVVERALHWLLDAPIGATTATVRWYDDTDHPVVRASDAVLKYGARMYRGEVDTPNGVRFVLTLATFEIESQGFPKGSRGADGAVTVHLHGTANCVFRLTQELALKAAARAESALASTKAN